MVQRVKRKERRRRQREQGKIDAAKLVEVQRHLRELDVRLDEALDMLQDSEVGTTSAHIKPSPKVKP